MKYETKARLLLEEHADLVRIEDVDNQEAISRAVNWVFRGESDEFKADLNARLVESWDKDQDARLFNVAKQIENAYNV